MHSIGEVQIAETGSMRNPTQSPGGTHTPSYPMVEGSQGSQGRPQGSVNNKKWLIAVCRRWASSQLTRRKYCEISSKMGNRRLTLYWLLIYRQEHATNHFRSRTMARRAHFPKGLRGIAKSMLPSCLRLARGCEVLHMAWHYALPGSKPIFSR